MINLDLIRLVLPRLPENHANCNNEANVKGEQPMKRKIAVDVIAAIFVLTLAQAGFTASNGSIRGSTGKGLCQNCCKNWSIEEQEQVRAAREEYRQKIEAFREEFREKQHSCREECLDRLPEAARERMKERAAARRAEQNHAQMRGPHCHGERYRDAD